MPGRIHAGPISGPLDAVWRLGLRKKSPPPRAGASQRFPGLLAGSAGRVFPVACILATYTPEKGRLKKGVSCNTGNWGVLRRVEVYPGAWYCNT
jgi:hypothetical protein